VDLEMVTGRFRFVVIAMAVLIIAGFAVLGAQLWLMNARIDQLATKVNGIDTTFGVKLEETNAKLDAASTKLDAISQRLPAEFKTIGAEIAAQTHRDRQKHRVPARPSAVTSHLSPTRTPRPRRAPIPQHPDPELLSLDDDEVRPRGYAEPAGLESLPEAGRTAGLCGDRSC
jgi:hypothetical protein